jgi:hypothetical protein
MRDRRIIEGRAHTKFYALPHQNINHSHTNSDGEGR